MKIGICGNIELFSLADNLDRQFPGNDIVVGMKDAFLNELSNPEGEFLDINICIVALDWVRFVPDLYEYGAGDDPELVKSIFASKTKELDNSFRQFRSRVAAPLLVFSPVNEYLGATGFIDRLLPYSAGDLFAKCQNEFNSLCRGLASVYPIDLELLSSRFGKDLAFDNDSDCSCNQPFSSEFLSKLGAHIVLVINQLIKYPLKCLVLDLDNTLWGGIVGEVGIDGIVLDDSGPGRAFRNLQSYIVKLYKQGVLLAVCSKNNTCDALEVLELHSKMLIRPSMISSFRINWENKPKNIVEISRELNIGFESIMFIDDNPSERALVKLALPEVEVLELPDNPALYADCLANSSRFWPVQLSADDFKKGEFFQQEKIRRRSAELAQNLEKFLFESDIRAIVKMAVEESLPRIHQLFSKTNQFNSTTRRYSLVELARFMEEKNAALYSLEVKDRYGEYGLVGAALINGNRIDSFLLSCRVFGKQVERAFLAWILYRMRTRGELKVTGVFIPSNKNSMVKKTFELAGFEFKESRGEEQHWVIDLEEIKVECPAWIQVSSNISDHN